MVRLNGSRGTAKGRATFYHIRIKGPLGQELSPGHFLRFLLKHPDEFLPDELPLLLRVNNSFQPPQKPFPGLNEP